MAVELLQGRELASFPVGPIEARLLLTQFMLLGGLGQQPGIDCRQVEVGLAFAGSFGVNASQLEGAGGFVDLGEIGLAQGLRISTDPGDSVIDLLSDISVSLNVGLVAHNIDLAITDIGEIAN